VHVFLIVHVLKREENPAAKKKMSKMSHNRGKVSLLAKTRRHNVAAKNFVTVQHSKQCRDREYPTSNQDFMHVDEDDDDDGNHVR